MPSFQLVSSKNSLITCTIRIPRLGMHKAIFHNSQQNLVGTKEELEKFNFCLIKNGHLTGRLGLLLIQPGTLYRKTLMKPIGIKLVEG